MSKKKQQLPLPDGRVLSYDEHGPPDGFPLLYFHGSPGSRLAWDLFVADGVAEELHIRAIVPDRPGMGLSGFQPGRRVGDWPADVVALADHLGLTRFAVLGYSGGGPYAVACALQIPQRITRVGIVSGTAPFDAPGLTLGIERWSLRLLQVSRVQPRLFRLALRLMGFGARHTPRMAARLTMLAVADPDRAMLAEPQFRDRFMAMVREAVLQGPRGTQEDLARMVSPWGFRIEDVRVPVHLWHGEADKNAPFAMGRYMAEAIPNSVLTSRPGEGHLSVMAKYAREILEALMEPASRAAGTPPDLVTGE